MKAETYLNRFRNEAAEVVDDPERDIDFRLCRFYQHVARIEACFLTEQITQKRYGELMDEWNRHWPFVKREAK